MTELQAHLTETRELHTAMDDVVDVFGRLHGALAVQRACMVPDSVYRVPLKGMLPAPLRHGVALTVVYFHRDCFCKCCICSSCQRRRQVRPQGKIQGPAQGSLPVTHTKRQHCTLGKRSQVTLKDALKAAMPTKMQTPTAMEHLVAIMKLAKERRDAAKASAVPDGGFSLRDVHAATGRPMMACNAYLSALVAGKFVERRSDTGRKGAGITFHWLPPRARASRR